MLIRSVARLAVALVVAALPAAAQGALPDTLVWERYGAGWPGELNVRGLAFEADTLYVVTNHDVVRLDPGDQWRSAFGQRATDGTDMGGHEAISVDGPTVLLAGRGLLRSVDGGGTFTEVLDRAERLPLRLPTGRLLVMDGSMSGRDVVATSDDGGATWDRRLYPPTFGLAVPAVLVPGGPGADPALPPSGRVLGAGMSGVVTSDDGGETWAASDLACGRCVRVASVVTLDGGPEGGRAVASVDDNRPGGVSGGVWHSADGARWALVGRSVADLVDVRLRATPGGGLLAFSTAEDRVLGSDDGGRTWRALGDIDPTGDYRVEDVVVGPDGHAYAATAHRFATPPAYGAVYRTVGPVFAVASGVAAPGAPALMVTPNPARGSARVRVGLGPSGGGWLRVVDVRGREVRRVRLAGVAEEAVRLDLRGLASGVYAVVAEAGGRRATGRLVVAR